MKKTDIQTERKIEIWSETGRERQTGREFCEELCLFFPHLFFRAALCLCVFARCPSHWDCQPDTHTHRVASSEWLGLCGSFSFQHFFLHSNTTPSQCFCPLTSFPCPLFSFPQNLLLFFHIPFSFPCVLTPCFLCSACVLLSVCSLSMYSFLHKHYYFCLSPAPFFFDLSPCHQPHPLSSSPPCQLPPFPQPYALLLSPTSFSSCLFPFPLACSFSSCLFSFPVADSLTHPLDPSPLPLCVSLSAIT